MAAAQLGRVGVWSSPLRTGDAGEAREAAAELEELGYGAIWVPGRGPDDLEGRLRDLLEPTTRIAVATGIVSIWTHPAAATAALHARLSPAFGNRLLLGLGVSHEAIVQQAGRAYRRPYSAMLAYLDALDASETPVPQDELAIAALAPRMLALARERTRGSHPYLVTPQHTRIAREALGPDALLAPEQTVILERDADRARSLAREWLARYLQMPNYADNLLRLGFSEQDVRDGGGSDHLVDELVTWGDAGDVLAQVEQHRAAGADHVTLQVLTPELDRLPREQWRRIAAALR